MVRASIRVLRDGIPSHTPPTPVFHLREVIGLARVGVRLHALLQNGPRGTAAVRIALAYSVAADRLGRVVGLGRSGDVHGPALSPSGQMSRPDPPGRKRSAGRNAAVPSGNRLVPRSASESIACVFRTDRGGSAELVNQRGRDLKRGLHERPDRPASGRRPDVEGGGHRPQDVSPLAAPAALTDLARLPATAPAAPSRPRRPAPESGWMRPISARTTAQPGSRRRAIGCGLT
jgi:hypothetical protein